MSRDGRLPATFPGMKLRQDVLQRVALALVFVTGCTSGAPGEGPTGGSGGEEPDPTPQAGAGGRASGGVSGSQGGGGSGGSPGSGGAGGASGGASGRDAGTDGDESETDAQASMDGRVAPTADAGPTPPPPAGKVPMFVAAGHGGRTVTSCDDGRTWIANHAYENRNVDHSPYTEKGFVYGNGTFMHLIGWGAPGSVKISRNGVDWKRVEMPRGGDGGLVFVEKPAPAFVALGGYGGCQTSTNGETWTRCRAPSYPENLREAGGGGPALGVGGDIAAVFSFDGGQTWRGGGGGCTLTNGFGNLGQQGGFAFGKALFVGVASTGSWCQTANLGATWKTGRLASGASGKLAFLGDRFWAPNGREVHWSEDGVTWTREAFKPDGTVIHAMARSPGGTYVGIQRAASSDRYYRSTDGITWTLVMGPGGTELRRVVFGYGEPSAMCPMR